MYISKLLRLTSHPSTHFSSLKPPYSSGFLTQRCTLPSNSSSTTLEYSQLHLDSPLKAMISNNFVFLSSIFFFKNLFPYNNWHFNMALGTWKWPCIHFPFNRALLADNFAFSFCHSRMMATNYLSAFSLSKLLLPLLRNSPVPSRIVNVTSFTHRSGKNLPNMCTSTFSIHIYWVRLMHPQNLRYSKISMLLENAVCPILEIQKEIGRKWISCNLQGRICCNKSAYPVVSEFC